METALLISRVVLAALLVAAAFGKIIDRDRFQASLRDFGVAPRWRHALALIIPISESLAAVLLLVPQTLALGAIVTLALLLTFTAAISYNLVLGRAPECNCFGQIGRTTISPRTLFRNVILASLAAVLVVETPSPILSDQQLLFIIALAIAALAATLFALVYEVARRQEDLAQRIDDLQEFLEGGSFAGSATGAAHRAQRELLLGAPAPSFQLTSLDGRQLGLDDILSARRPVVIFFLSSDCAPCLALLPEIDLWRHELGGRLSLVIVSKGSIQSNRAKFANAHLDSSIPVLADEDGAIAREYRVTWTPGAICIGADGTIASQLATGDKQIRSLLKHLTLSPTSKPWLSSTQPEGDGQGDVPQIGESSPVLELRDTKGSEINLERGTKTLLLFWGPNCGYCKDMLEDLRLWEKSRSDGAPHLLVVTRGNAETHEELLINSPVVFDDDLRISRAFGTPGTPSAIIIDGEGKVASALGAGAEEVFALVGYRRRTNSRD